jgi:hypothetical protein
MLPLAATALAAILPLIKDDRFYTSAGIDLARTRRESSFQRRFGLLPSKYRERFRM